MKYAFFRIDLWHFFVDRQFASLTVHIYSYVTWSKKQIFVKCLLAALSFYWRMKSSQKSIGMNFKFGFESRLNSQYEYMSTYRAWEKCKFSSSPQTCDKVLKEIKYKRLYRNWKRLYIASFTKVFPLIFFFLYIFSDVERRF